MGKLTGTFFLNDESGLRGFLLKTVLQSYNIK